MKVPHVRTIHAHINTGTMLLSYVIMFQAFHSVNEHQPGTIKIIQLYLF